MRSVCGVRPAATRMSEPSIVRSPGRRLDLETHCTRRIALYEACVAETTSMPSCSKTVWTAAATSGSSRPEAVSRIQEYHPTAEPPERLRELHSHVSAAERDQEYTGSRSSWSTSTWVSG